MYVVRPTTRIIDKQPVTVYQVVNTKTGKVRAEYNDEVIANQMAEIFNKQED